jgi:hypothetical protein
LQITDWTGGSGTEPTTGQYIGVSGLVSNIADAVDIRGAAGANGTNGTAVLNGSTPPDNSVGVNGDFYLDTVTYLLYGPKAAGVWPSGVSIIGPTNFGLLANNYFFTDHFSEQVVSPNYRSSLVGAGTVGQGFQTGVYGILQLQTATLATDLSGLVRPSAVGLFYIPQTGTYRNQIAANFLAIPTSTRQFIFRTAAFNSAVQIGIRVIWLGSAAVFQCFANNGVLESSFPSDITVSANTWYSLAFEIVNRSSVQFWINGILQAETIVTNIAAVDLQYIMQLQNNTSTQANTVRIDILQESFVRPERLSWKLW